MTKKAQEGLKRLISRLTISEQTKVDYQEIKKALEENAKLREANKRLMEAFRFQMQEHGEYQTKIKNENQELKAEIARLSALLDTDRLRKIIAKINHEDGKCCSIFGTDECKTYECFNNDVIKEIRSSSK